MSFEHRPVLLAETVDGLKIKPDGVYVDGTAGGGGHGFAICSLLGKNGRYVGIDRDGAAVEAASKKLLVFGDKATVIRGNYRDMKELLLGLGIEKADGILLDLGLSSYQIDESGRGFSYMSDEPLDMRMDLRQKKTASEVVNRYSESELYRIIRDYGEDRFAKNIAKHIVSERMKKPIQTAGQLNAVISAAIPMKVRKTSGHPSKRTFQAIRIEVNGELDALKDTLDDMADLLRPGGRLCIITFHSLEDRIVKEAFRRIEDPCICPKDFPVCVCGRVSKGKVITKKPIVPKDGELAENTRSKSAKLRIFEHI